MATEVFLNLKEVIEFLRLSRPNRETKFYKDWTRIEFDGGGESWRKDEFKCELHWQEVKLQEINAHTWLYYAKQDLEEGSEKGIVNALSNADTAIRCRVDELLTVLTGFFARKTRTLPRKIEILEGFDIPTPYILKRLITSKRNKLVHDYKRAEKQEVKDAVELADLFINSTDQYIEKGYIASAMVAYISWFKPAILAPTWFGGTIGQAVTSKYGYHDGFSDEYRLAFDLEREIVTLSYWGKELYRKCDLKTGREKGRKEHVIKEKAPADIAIADCKMEDIRDLMVLLRERCTEERTLKEGEGQRKDDEGL